MNVEYAKFPNKADWEQIYAASPFDPMFSLFNRIRVSNPSFKDIDAFAKALELKNLLHELQQRLSDAAISYVLMMFYYKQGIPDKRWYISPGERGHSIEYFPDFEDRHFHVKGWFDFYCDTLYYKLFSAWDLVGHILNVKYDLGVLRVDFSKAVNAAVQKDPTLRATWGKVTDSPIFKKATRIRHDITHNYLPSTTGMTVNVEESSVGVRGKRKEYGFDIKKYLTSDELVTNINETLDLFKFSLEKVWQDL